MPDVTVDEATARLFVNIRDDAQRLDDPRMRELWLDALQTFANTGNSAALIEVCKWRRPVVDMDKFLFDETYMGLQRDEVYPAVVDLLHELDTDKYHECVLGGALGVGKTFGANIFTARSIYKISCMRHPQATFGLQARSAIVFTIQSVRLNTAKKAVFEELGQYIRNSPYFKVVYPYDKYVMSAMIFREHRVTIMPVSSSTTGVISMNVIGGQLDEANFFQRILKSKSSAADEDGSLDQAKNLYNALARRRKSRFVNKGRVPGIFFIIGSTKFPDDFTARKAAEAEMMGGTDPGIYVWHKAQWDVKPADKFMSERFRIQVGNDLIRTKILVEGETCNPDCEEIQVPQDFYQEFRNDPDGALRDFAGVTSRALRPFIPNRDRVRDCMDYAEEQGFVNPFEHDTYDFSYGIPSPDPSKLHTDIDTVRAVHVDMGLSSDAAGIAIGHVAGLREVQRKDPEGNFIQSEILPVVAYDVILRVRPPHGGEIEFSYIRQFIKNMRDIWGLPIQYVTFDGFESVDSRQILKTQGFMTDYLSVDKTMEPYNSFKTAIYDVRCMLLRNNILSSEIAGLQYAMNRTGGRQMVDHRPEGSKDVADAACGVYAFLANRKFTWRDVGVANRVVIELPQLVEEIEKNQDLHARVNPIRRVITTRPNPQRRLITQRPVVERA